MDTMRACVVCGRELYVKCGPDDTIPEHIMCAECAMNASDTRPRWCPFCHRFQPARMSKKIVASVATVVWLCGKCGVETKVACPVCQGRGYVE